MAFDEKEGLLITTLDEAQEAGRRVELHGRDLATGTLRYRKIIDFKEAEWSSARSWQLVLSTDAGFIACYDNHSSIHIFDVRDQTRHLFSINKHDNLLSFCLSTTSNQLALLNLNGVVEVWSHLDGTIKHRLPMPSETVSRDHLGMILCRPDYMQFSADGRYLAVRGDEQAIAVFDLHADALVGVCAEAETPHFMADNKNMVAMFGPYMKGLPRAYQIDDGKMTPLTPASTILSENEQPVVANASVFFTVQTVEPSLDDGWPKWVPNAVKDWFKSVQGRSKHVVTFRERDVRTNQLRREFTIVAGALSRLRLSPDGQLLATNEGTQACLWDIPPSHSLTCWLVCSGIVLFALLLAWPRRIRQTQPHH